MMNDEVEWKREMVSSGYIKRDNGSPRRLGWLAAIVMVMTPLFGLMPARAVAMNYAEIQQQFARSNEDYQNKKFNEARDGYLALIRAGVRDPVLFYNAGNTYVQLNQKGRAEVMYLRALRLTPRDPQARRNLAYVRPAGSVAAPFVLWRPFIYVRDLLSLNEWLLAADAALTWIAIACSLVLLLRGGTVRAIARGGLIVGIVLAVAAAGFAPWRWYQERGRHIAVVVQNEVVSRHGPSMTLGEHMKLAEGTRVQIMDHEGNGWLCVRPLDVADGPAERTYVRQDAVEEV